MMDGRIIKDARINAGLTLQELSDRSGLSMSLLSMLENGKRSLTLETCAKLSSVIGLYNIHVDVIVSSEEAELLQAWRKGERFTILEMVNYVMV